MIIDTTLPETGNEDYVVLEEEYQAAQRIYAVIKAGGSLKIGNFGVFFKTDENGVTRIELRYSPKGNFYKPEFFGIKKKKKELTDTTVAGEVEL